MKATPRPFRSVRPGIDARGLRVPLHVEHLNLALPDGLPSVLLVYRDGFDPRGFAAVEVSNGINESGEAGGVHVTR
jgi:hypothetical protein